MLSAHICLLLEFIAIVFLLKSLGLFVFLFDDLRFDQHIKESSLSITQVIQDEVVIYFIELISEGIIICLDDFNGLS